MMKGHLQKRLRRKKTRTSEAPPQTDESLDPEALEGLVAQVSQCCPPLNCTGRVSGEILDSG